MSFQPVDTVLEIWLGPQLPYTYFPQPFYFGTISDEILWTVSAHCHNHTFYYPFFLLRRVYMLRSKPMGTWAEQTYYDLLYEPASDIELRNK
jgi:hypothetical protein